MDRDIAMTLVEELERQFKTIKVDQGKFIDALVATEIPESSRFAKRVNPNEQSVEDSNRIGTLSMRRVLRNKNATQYKVRGWRAALDTVATYLRLESSDIFRRRLLESGEIVQLMQACSLPYSLLAKFTLVDQETQDGYPRVLTHPVLIIPGVENRTPIMEWEQRNTKYEAEKPFGFLPYRHTISSDQF